MTDLQRVKKAINWLVFIGFAENERDIAEKLGYKKASLSQILNGHSPLSEKFVKNLCSADENLNEVWILKGVGDMFLNHESASSPVEMVSIPKDVWDVIKGQADSLKSRDKQVDELMSMLKEQITENKKTAARQGDNVTSAAVG